MDIIGVSGLFISIAGFGLAMWQLKRTRKAAEAAEAASKDASKSVRYIQSIASIQDICGRSRELLHLTRARNLHSSATAAFELRDSVARFQGTEVGKRIDTKKNWNDIFSSICTVHDSLESAALINRIDAQDREVMLHNISRIHSHFSSLAAITADTGV
ncbi:hypothetical protein [Pseudomonas fragi]|uniref:hypothetical protein n=1 Tax=Pseudomonas fragi TaxID=296 RepID=UPI001F2593E4|nr:hypothetical protein [Pseudomonas fragi]MCF6763813.1 hypothetical protein [Pseudomonas fragi]